MAWMVPLTRLEPEQREFLRRVRPAGAGGSGGDGPDDPRSGGKNLWVKGFAGSGKSVLLVHALINELRANPTAQACVVVFTRSLIDMFREGIPAELLRDPTTNADGVPVMTYHEFKKDGRHFDLVLVDEVQDLPADVLEVLRERSRRLIVAGDEAQSIYDHGVAPDAIQELTACEPFSLTIVHRLTQKIITIVKSILPEKNLEFARGSRLANVDVVLATAENRQVEDEWVWQQAENAAAPSAPAAILFPKVEMAVNFANGLLERAGRPTWEIKLNRFSKPDLGELNRVLERAGLQVRYLGNGYGSLAEGDSESRVFLMTYHSVKGLDFETVFVPRLSSTTEIWRGDKATERTLLFVALTRSRLNLFLSHTDLVHPLLARLPQGLVRPLTVSRDNLFGNARGMDDDIPF